MGRMQTKLMMLLAMLMFAVVAIWRLSSAPDYQLFGVLKHRVEVPDKVIALTFDDGPTAKYTPWVLQVLAEQQVPATFFLIGQEVAAQPELVRDIIQAGHQVGNHSYSHQRMLFKSPSFIASEIEQTDALLRAQGVDGTIYVRPPYGKKLLMLPWYLMKHQRVAVTWDVAPENYSAVNKSADALIRYTLNEVRPGSVILLHIMYDSRQVTRDALPELIRQLKLQGYRFVTVHELLRLEQSRTAG